MVGSTALLDGYQSERTLSLAEWDAFPNELRFSAFRFTLTRLRDFFFRHMDERRRVNKDYREFFHRLRILRRERSGGMDQMLLTMATGYDYPQVSKDPCRGKRRERLSPARPDNIAKASGPLCFQKYSLPTEVRSPPVSLGTCREMGICDRGRVLRG